MLTKLKELYYNLKNGIVNLFVYFPVIFKTREYDFSFIYILLQFKLKQTRTYLEKTNYISDIEIVSKQIRICENLIERLLSNNYNGFLQQRHKEKFGDLNFDVLFIPNNKDNTNSPNMKFIYTKCTTDEEVELADNEQSEIFKLDVDAYDRDKKLLFKMLYKYISNWWE